MDGRFPLPGKQGSTVALRFQVIRGALRLLLPVHAPLPMRHWRWTWAALVFRLLVGVPAFLALVVPYYAMSLLVILIDELGGMIGSVYARCYNRDLRASGWRPQPERSLYEIIVTIPGREDEHDGAE